jgi:hypothetical protein
MCTIDVETRKPIISHILRVCLATLRRDTNLNQHYLRRHMNPKTY